MAHIFVKLHPKDYTKDDMLSEETALEETSHEAIEWMKVNWGTCWKECGWLYSCIGERIEGEG